VGLLVGLTVGTAGVGPAASNAATPTLSATPSMGLRDGEVITAAGAGFSPHALIGVAECRAGLTSQADCDIGGSTTLSADATGAFTTSFGVARVIQAGGATIDCAAPGACVLGAGNLANIAGERALTPIQFDPSIPRLQISLTAGSGPLLVSPDGSVSVTGTVTCNQSASVSLLVRLQQPQGGLIAQGFGQVPPLACTTSPAAWSAAVRSPAVAFQTGAADLQVQASGPTRSPSTPLDVAVTLQGPARTPMPRYYLAMGDSVPVFPDPTTSYAADLTAFYRTQIPGFTLINIACSSETTTTLLHGGICTYPAGPQINAAEAFLAAHPGQVALITIDIGGNDVLPCASAPTSATCFTQALHTMDVNLTQILARLRQAAGGSVPIAAMNYYDPLLIDWLDGPAGQAQARLSVTGIGVLNTHLASDYASFGITVADVAASFSIEDFSDLVSSPWGTIPKNVALSCTWLDVQCRIGGPQGFGDDPNEAGSRVIAAAFEQVINLTETPPPPTATTITVTPRFTG
jgi:lysophospholipase L1-like esterase